MSSKYNWLARRSYSPTVCACFSSIGCGSGHRGNPTVTPACPNGRTWICPACGARIDCYPSTTPGFTHLFNGTCSPGCPGGPAQAPQTAPAAPQAAPMMPRPYLVPDAPPRPPQPHLAVPYLRERIGSADAILAALGHKIRVPDALPFPSGSFSLGCPRCKDKGTLYLDEHPALPYAGAIFNFYCKERPS